MTADTVVMVRAGTVFFTVFTSFARVPHPGEHVFLWPSEAQLALLGPTFGLGSSKQGVAAIVRDTVLRPKDQWRRNLPDDLTEPIGDHIADVFVDAISSASWTANLKRWTTGGE